MVQRMVILVLAFLLLPAIWAIPISDESSASFHDAERADFVSKINAVPGIMWKAAAHPRFRGQPIGASRPLLGVPLNSRELLKAKVARGEVRLLPKAEKTSLPDDFDSVTHFTKCSKVIGDIRDQSNCGCCWAFAAAEAASDRMCIATNGSIALPLSSEDVCFCGSDDGCNGGIPADAWQYIQQSGAVTGGQQGAGPFDADGLCADFTMPHCHHHGPQGNDPYPAEGAKGCAPQSSKQCPTKCYGNASSPHNNFASDKYKFDGDVVQYPQDADTIAQNIMAHGPVEAAFSVYSDFENYAGGIYHHVSGSQLGGHAVKIVGWGVENGVKYWKVANSWNPYWGEHGYFRIRRGDNDCGIEEQTVSSDGSSSWAGGNLPPAPPPPSGCVGAMRKYCGEAKTAGPSVCRGCCDAYQGDLSAAGCTESAEDTWCEQTEA